jgi:3-hydroxyisobutyrate dehydrogenase
MNGQGADFTPGRPRPQSGASTWAAHGPGSAGAGPWARTKQRVVRPAMIAPRPTIAACCMTATRTYEPIPARQVAFLGLGVMGAPMAGHLARAGHQVTVYNRTAAKAAAWLGEHAGLDVRHAPTPAAAAAGAAVIFACVGNDDDLREVSAGSVGAFGGMAPGAIFVDHTTASAAVARELHAAARARGLHFIDAPVSGGQAGAVNGALTVMCGGDAEPFEAMRPVALAFARAVTRVGASGAGQLAKMVNQISIAGLVQGLSEAITFGERAGLDMAQVLEVIGKGAAQSWQMDNRGKTMLARKFDFGFAVDLMRKDLGLVLAEARRNGAQLPVTALVDQFYAELQSAGHARSDTSSLIARLKPEAPAA